MSAKAKKTNPEWEDLFADLPEGGADDTDFDALFEGIPSEGDDLYLGNPLQTITESLPPGLVRALGVLPSMARTATYDAVSKLTGGKPLPEGAYSKVWETGQAPSVQAFAEEGLGVPPLPGALPGGMNPLYTALDLLLDPTPIVGKGVGPVLSKGVQAGSKGLSKVRPRQPYMPPRTHEQIAGVMTPENMGAFIGSPVQTTTRKIGERIHDSTFQPLDKFAKESRLPGEPISEMLKKDGFKGMDRSLPQFMSARISQEADKVTQIIQGATKANKVGDMKKAMEPLDTFIGQLESSRSPHYIEAVNKVMPHLEGHKAVKSPTAYELHMMKDAAQERARAYYGAGENTLGDLYKAQAAGLRQETERVVGLVSQEAKDALKRSNQIQHKYLTVLPQAQKMAGTPLQGRDFAFAAASPFIPLKGAMARARVGEKLVFGGLPRRTIGKALQSVSKLPVDRAIRVFPSYTETMFANPLGEEK